VVPPGGQPATPAAAAAAAISAPGFEAETTAAPSVETEDAAENESPAGEAEAPGGEAEAPRDGTPATEGQPPEGPLAAAGFLPGDHGPAPLMEEQDPPGDDEPADRAGYFIPPHIFADVPPTATIAQEEIFGPVLSVFRAANFEEALQLALGVKYGLTGGLYSRNPAHIMRAAREFRVGNLYVNRPITGAMVGRQPFGGSRMSGVGSKAGGPDYLLQFMEPRVVTENTIRRGFAPEIPQAK
jgi:hypothetical protein